MSENYVNALGRDTILAGKYIIEDVLGEGGFGITYLCRDLNMNAKVAIKEYFPLDISTRSGIIVSAYTDSVELYRRGLERFVNEAALLAQYNTYPGIVSVKEFFYENNTAYIVMEYIDGISMDDYLANRGGRLPWKEAVKMVCEMLPTLDLIHKRGLIHRDISPDNIIVTKDGHYKLIDFGAARAMNMDSNQGRKYTVMLKHGYAPPEQYDSGGLQGPWTDVYAICATLFHMIMGIPSQAADERAQGRDELSLGMRCPRRLKNVLIKGMSIEIEDRYQSAIELKTALEKTLKFPIGILLPVPAVIIFAAIFMLKSVWMNHQEVPETQATVAVLETTENSYAHEDALRNESIGEETEEEKENEIARIFHEVPENDLIQEIEDFAGGYVYDSFYDDFDGDGVREMFALSVSNEVSESSLIKEEDTIRFISNDMNGSAVLCFANEDGPRMVSDIFTLFDTGLEIKKFAFTEGIGLFLERNGQLDRDRFIYGVHDGEVTVNNLYVLDKFGIMGSFEYRNEEGILFVKARYCLQSDDNYKEKYIRVIPEGGLEFYEDWVELTFHNGILYEKTFQEISQKDLLEYDGVNEAMRELRNRSEGYGLYVPDSGGTLPDMIADCDLWQILSNGENAIYMCYAGERPDSNNTIRAYTVRLKLRNGNLSFEDIETGLKTGKVTVFGSCETDTDGSMRYTDQTEEELWIAEMLTKSEECLIDYLYDDFNNDGRNEILGVLSYVPGTAGSHNYNNRTAFEAPFDIWQVTQNGCNKTDITMQEAQTDTFYLGCDILQFGAEKHIQIDDEIIARTGDYYRGVLIAVNENGDFYMTAAPYTSLTSVDGVSYVYEGAATIDTPYYGVGFNAFLLYPIYYIDNEYKEMVSVEIDKTLLERLDNWPQVEKEITDIIANLDVTGNHDACFANYTYRHYYCYDADITEVFYNEIGKIYVNYTGYTIIPEAADMGADTHPATHVSAELNLEGNHIESYDMMFGERERSGTGYLSIESDASKLFR